MSNFLNFEAILKNGWVRMGLLFVKIKRSLGMIMVWSSGVIRSQRKFIWSENYLSSKLFNIQQVWILAWHLITLHQNRSNILVHLSPIGKVMYFFRRFKNILWRYILRFHSYIKVMKHVQILLRYRTFLLSGKFVEAKC